MQVKIIKLIYKDQEVCNLKFEKYNCSPKAVEKDIKGPDIIGLHKLHILSPA